MAIPEKFRRFARIEWTPEVPTYYKPAEMIKNHLEMGKVMSLYINERSKYGPSAVLGFESDGFEGWLNLPSHMVKMVRDILEDNDCLEDIKDGHVGYTIKTYKYNGKDHYTVDFCEYLPN